MLLQVEVGGENVDARWIHQVRWLRKSGGKDAECRAEGCRGQGKLGCRALVNLSEAACRSGSSPTSLFPHFPQAPHAPHFPHPTFPGGAKAKCLWHLLPPPKKNTW